MKNLTCIMKQTTFGGCFIFLITKYSPILTSLMKRLISRSGGKLLFLFFMAAAIPWLLPSCNKDIDAPDTGEDAVVTIDYSGSGEVIPGKYIVMFSKDAIPETQMKAASSAQERDALVRTVSDEILTANRIAIPGYDFIYGTAIRGFAASMTDEDAAKLKNDRRVAIVEPDKVIALGPPSGVGKPPPPPSGQTTPWGITRVGGGVNYTGTKKAWIIDTGVDLTHLRPECEHHAERYLYQQHHAKRPEWAWHACSRHNRCQEQYYWCDRCCRRMPGGLREGTQQARIRHHFRDHCRRELCGCQCCQRRCRQHEPRRGCLYHPGRSCAKCLLQQHHRQVYLVLHRRRQFLCQCQQLFSGKGQWRLYPDSKCHGTKRSLGFFFKLRQPSH
jgi:hypothetical protein